MNPVAYLGFYLVCIHSKVTNSRRARQWRIYDLSKVRYDGLIKSCTGLYSHQLSLAVRITFQKSISKNGDDFLLSKYATGWINVTKYFSKQRNYKIVLKYMKILCALNINLITFFHKHVSIMSYCTHVIVIYKQYSEEMISTLKRI